MGSNKIKLKHYYPQEIDAELLFKMEKFVREISPDLPPNHIEKNHLRKEDVEFMLMYVDDELISITSCIVKWIPHPFTQKETLLTIGDLAYRKPHKGLNNTSKIAGKAFLHKHLGRLWFLRSFISIGFTVNPKLFIQFYQFYKHFYPIKGQRIPEAIRAFANEHISLSEGHNVDLNENMVSCPDFRYDPKIDITHEYLTKYRSPNENINRYYFDGGVFVKEGEKMYLTNRSIAMVGFYSPWKQVFRRRREFG